jgi:hypothetical protein
MMTTDGVYLYWIPLGAGSGGAAVRWSGRVYEALAAAVARRPRCQLFHSALAVQLDGLTTTIEMAPVWSQRGDRGVVSEGAVGSRWLGSWRLFRYEVRCWPGGSIPDAASAIGEPLNVIDDPAECHRLLSLVAGFPTHTWGRNASSTGDMWNSNSLTAWLLARSGVDITALAPPHGGRAPGWQAGVVAATRGEPSPRVVSPR